MIPLGLQPPFTVNEHKGMDTTIPLKYVYRGGNPHTINETNGTDMDFEFDRLVDAIAPDKALTDLFVHVYAKITPFYQMNIEWKNGYMITRIGERGLLFCTTYFRGQMSFLWIGAEPFWKGFRHTANVFSSVVRDYDEDTDSGDRQKRYFDAIFDRLNEKDYSRIGLPPDGWEEWQNDIMQFTMSPRTDGMSVYTSNGIQVKKVSALVAVFEDLILFPIYAKEAKFEPQEFYLSKIPMPLETD